MSRNGRWICWESCWEAGKRALYNKILAATEAPGRPDLVPWSHYFRDASGQFVYSTRKFRPARACRPAAERFCQRWLGRVYTGWMPYHRKEGTEGLPTRWLVFRKRTIRAGVGRIGNYFDHDTPVVVGLARYYGVPARKADRLIAYHWVAIVARSEGHVLLYLDPWPSPQSQCKYKGKKRIMMGYLFYERRVDRKDAVLLAPDVRHPDLPAGGAVIKGA